MLERALRRFIEVCRAQGDVREVYVFGSLARGDVGPTSDLDVLVVRDTKARRAERDVDLRIAFDVPVGLDAIVVTPAEYREQLPTTGFGRTILAEAKLVHAA